MYPSTWLSLGGEKIRKAIQYACGKLAPANPPSLASTHRGLGANHGLSR